MNASKAAMGASVEDGRPDVVVRREVSEQVRCVNASQRCLNPSSHSVSSELWACRAPVASPVGTASVGPRHGQWRICVSCDFEIDLGSDGPAVYRVLRAGQRRTISAFLAARADLRSAQQARLKLIVDQMAESEFGRAHGLSRVRTLDDLAHSAPVRTYADLQPWFDRIVRGETGVLTREPVRMLLETSGTTGRPKLLPCTRSWERSVSAAQAIWVLRMVADHPEIRKGQALTVVSPETHSVSSGGVPIGSNTGRMHRRQPWFVRARYPVPDAVYVLKPSALKWYALLRFAMQAQITTITTANPSTILLMCRLLQQWRLPLSRDLADGTLRHGPARRLGRLERFRLERGLRRVPPPADFRPGHIWPLKLVNCWKGGPAGYFTARLPDALGVRVPIREVGITASEGYFALPLGDDWPGGVMWPLGHVLEFIGDDGRPRFGWQLEQGERVRLVITTEAGLYRYDLADDLRVVGHSGQLPVLRFEGKTGRWLNATGEKVTEAQVSAAMQRAAEATCTAEIAGFSARTAWADVPTIEVCVEGVPPDRLTALAAAFDRALRRENVEYDAKRESARLGDVVFQPAPEGTFRRWRAARVAAGAPDGQVKDPILSTTDDEWARVVAACL